MLIALLEAHTTICSLIVFRRGEREREKSENAPLSLFGHLLLLLLLLTLFRLKQQPRTARVALAAIFDDHGDARHSFKIARATGEEDREIGRIAH